MFLEVSSMMVVDEADNPFARVFYLDGEVYVEPMFPLVREIEDR